MLCVPGYTAGLLRFAPVSLGLPWAGQPGCPGLSRRRNPVQIKWLAALSVGDIYNRTINRNPAGQPEKAKRNIPWVYDRFILHFFMVLIEINGQLTSGFRWKFYSMELKCATVNETTHIINILFEEKVV